ncbi:response regulator [Bradyrhizobium japonicum]|uniref:response regulator n=1 Tax=Bradyrhizobium japonicum TaxID=375 RepID=UPI003B6841E3
MFTFEQFYWNQPTLARVTLGTLSNSGAAFHAKERALDRIEVLLVDDEDMVQRFVQETLEEAGFRTVMVSSGEEALSLLREGSDRYRALVTDVRLGPDVMDGWQLAREVREMHPEFPIVYMTGDSAEAWTAHGVPNSILLTKPFAPAQLVTAVSQLLIIGNQP